MILQTRKRERWNASYQRWQRFKLCAETYFVMSSGVRLRTMQNVISLREKATTVEAKIQSFIPGKLIIVSVLYRQTCGLHVLLVSFRLRGSEANLSGAARCRSTFNQSLHVVIASDKPRSVGVLGSC